MIHNNLSARRGAQVALAGLFVLLVGAVLFYRERLFADTSYIAFNIINSKRILIQNQRYGSFITQCVPAFCARLHLPLQAILIAYAASFNLFYLAVAGILYRLRQYSLTVLMALYYFLFASHSFFLANDELHQGIAWMFLLFGLTMHFGKKRSNIIVLAFSFVVLLFFAVSSHFIVFIPLAYIWLYLLQDRQHWPLSNKTTLLLAGILVALFTIKFILSGNSQGYEKVHLHHITHVSFLDIGMSFLTPVVSVFTHRCLINYWVAVLLFVASILMLLRTGRKGLALYTAFGTVGYFIVMGLVFADCDETTVYSHIETEWMALGIIISAPFAFTLMHHMRPAAAVAVMCIIVLTRLAYIADAANVYTWRTHFMKDVLALMKHKGINKAAIYYDRDLGRKLQLDWTVSEESLFLSAENGDNPHITFRFVYRDDSAALTCMKEPACLSLRFACLKPQELTKDYFRIDTTTPYSLMTYAELMK